MEILYLLNTLVLGVMLWDLHRGVRAIAHIAENINAKTDELLRRTGQQEASHKGCEQARLQRRTGAHLDMAWLASVRIGLTSWRAVPLLFSSCLTRIGALDRDAQQPCCYASADHAISRNQHHEHGDAP